MNTRPPATRAASIQCPNCGASAWSPNPNGIATLSCDYCGTNRSSSLMVEFDALWGAKTCDPLSLNSIGAIGVAAASMSATL